MCLRFIFRLWNDSLWEIASTRQRKRHNRTKIHKLHQFNDSQSFHTISASRRQLSWALEATEDENHVLLCKQRHVYVHVRKSVMNFQLSNASRRSKNITHFLPNSFVLLFRSFSLAISILRKNFELNWRSIKFISSFIECLQTSHRLIGANWFQLKCFLSEEENARRKKRLFTEEKLISKRIFVTWTAPKAEKWIACRWKWITWLVMARKLRFCSCRSHSLRRHRSRPSWPKKMHPYALCCPTPRPAPCSSTIHWPPAQAMTSIQTHVSVFRFKVTKSWVNEKYFSQPTTRSNSMTHRRIAPASALGLPITT